jgi:hypothetical protein
MPKLPGPPSWRTRLVRHIAPWVVVGILMTMLGGVYVVLSEEIILGVVLIVFGLLITAAAAFVAGF